MFVDIVRSNEIYLKYSENFYDLCDWISIYFTNQWFTPWSFLGTSILSFLRWRYSILSHLNVTAYRLSSFALNANRENLFNILLNFMLQSDVTFILYAHSFISFPSYFISHSVHCSLCYINKSNEMKCIIWQLQHVKSSHYIPFTLMLILIDLIF